MYIDVKCTIWNRLYIDDISDQEAILEELKNYPDRYPDIEINYSEDIENTTEYLPVSENGGNCTIELYNDEAEMIWDNTPDKFTNINK